MGGNCTSFRRIGVHICMKACCESDKRLERYYWISQTTVYYSREVSLIHEIVFDNEILACLLRILEE
jgi:hypothetical protein